MTAPRAVTLAANQPDPNSSTACYERLPPSLARAAAPGPPPPSRGARHEVAPAESHPSGPAARGHLRQVSPDRQAGRHAIDSQPGELTARASRDGHPVPDDGLFVDN